MTKVIQLLLCGACRTQKAACERVGLNPDYLSQVLHKPRYRAFIAREVRKTLANGTLRAAPKLIELIDSESAKVALESSRLVLALDGFAPPSHPQIVNNLNIIPGYNVVLPGYDLGIDGQATEVEGEAVGSDDE